MKSYQFALIILLALPCCFTQDAPEDKVEDLAAAGEVSTTEGAADETPAADEASGDKPTPGSHSVSDGNSISSFESDGDAMDFRDVKEDSTTVCKALKIETEENMKVNLTGSLSYEDMLKLMTWTLKYDLKSGKKALKLGKKLVWKREIIDLIFAVFKKGCPTEYVSESFINIARELAMIYLNSVNSKKNKKSDWHTLLKALRICPNKINPLKFTSKGFQADLFILKNKNGEEESVEILPPMEIADSKLPFIDIIVDTMWWVFSHSFASCYPYMESKTIALAQYKKLFYNDFLLNLIPRWKQGGRWTMAYGPIFGDVNIPQTLINIRFCVTAAYTQSALADRQLVRPLSMSETPGGVETIPNRKTGEPYA